MLTDKSVREFAFGLVQTEMKDGQSEHGEMTMDSVRQGWILTREYAEFIRETDMMMRQPLDEMMGPNHLNNPYWVPRKKELIQIAAVSMNILIRILQIEEASNGKS